MLCIVKNSTWACFDICIMGYLNIIKQTYIATFLSSSSYVNYDRSQYHTQWWPCYSLCEQGIIGPIIFHSWSRERLVIFKDWFQVYVQDEANETIHREIIKNPLTKCVSLSISWYLPLSEMKLRITLSAVYAFIFISQLIVICSMCQIINV